MPRSTDLAGRAAVIREVTSLLNAGRSVLLVGPEGIGKSAVIAAVAREGIAIVDPLERIGSERAHRLGRALDRGVVHLAASRVARAREQGAVGRILWRFTTVRVRELPDSIIRRIVAGELDAGSQPRSGSDRRWVREITVLARGRPGFAAAMARFAQDWRRRHGDLPSPALAFAATREDAAIERLTAPGAVHSGPRTHR